MRSALRARYEPSIRQAVDRLRTLDTQDEDEAWGCTADVLAWLYRAEQVERKEPNYYADRESSVSGRTLGGLLWFRGRVEHHGVDVRVVEWRETKPMITTPDGAWKEARVYLLTEGGEWRPSKVHAAEWAWPPVPPTMTDDRGHGRDEWYRAHIEGKAVLPPVEAAADFLLSR